MTDWSKYYGEEEDYSREWVEEVYIPCKRMFHDLSAYCTLCCSFHPEPGQKVADLNVLVRYDGRAFDQRYGKMNPKDHDFFQHTASKVIFDYFFSKAESKYYSNINLHVQALY